MTQKEVTALALQLFAIYILVQALLALPTLVGSLVATRDFMGPEFPTLWLWIGGAVAIAVSFALAVLLWRLAGKALSGSDVAQKGKQPAGLEPIILSALGIFLIVEALVRLGYLSAGAYVQASSVEPSEVPFQTKALLLGYLLQGVVGVSLVLRSEGWSAVLRKIRAVGLQ